MVPYDGPPEGRVARQRSGSGTISFRTRLRGCPAPGLGRPADISPPTRKQARERQTGRELETTQKSDITSMVIASRSRHQLVAAGLGD